MNTLTQIRLTTLAGAAALLLLRRFPTSPFYPACPIHQYTGFLCPGCGATRALAALTHAHLRDALHLNALVVLVVLPAAILYLAMACSRRRWPAVPAPLLYSAFTLTAIFTFLRNLS